MTLKAVNDSAATLDQEEARIGKEIADAASEIQAALGVGLPEAIYATCLAEELAARGIGVDTEVPVPVFYKGRKFNNGIVLDMLIEESIIVEVRTADLTVADEAQLSTYLKHADASVGYIINFNAPSMADGVKRMVRRK